MYDKELVSNILDQIIDAVLVIQERCEWAKNVNDFIDKFPDFVDKVKTNAYITGLSSLCSLPS